jgi:indolepyruvate ferredoxin oxidoreductase
MAVDPAAVERVASPADATPATSPAPRTLDETIAHRTSWLTDYQDAAYAGRYRALVEKVRAREGAVRPGSTVLTEAVARYAYKLMAYKDEYEVARLYADPAFKEKIKAQFEGDYKLHFHLAPPLIAKRDPVTGELRKAEYGTWVFTAFKVLAKLRGLRGTALDIFGYTAERRMERRLIGDYEAVMGEVLDRLESGNHALAVRIASIPEDIRGYGHVKERHLKAAKAKEAELLDSLRNPQAARSAA